MATIIVLSCSIVLLAAIVCVIAIVQSVRQGKNAQAIVQGIVAVIVTCGMAYLALWEYKNAVAEYEENRNMTVLDYYERRAKQMKEDPTMFPGVPHDVAVAVRNTTLMTGPSDRNTKIRIIYEGEQVHLFIVADYSEDMMSEYKKGDWIKVNSEGDVGWVDGNDFRIMVGEELDAQVLNGLKTALNFVFPDITLWGITKTLLVGIGITLLARIIGRFVEFVDKIHVVFPIAYFIVHGWEGRTLSFVEMGIIFWAIIPMLVIIECIVYLVIHRIFGWD